MWIGQYLTISVSCDAHSQNHIKFCTRLKKTAKDLDQKWESWQGKCSEITRQLSLSGHSHQCTHLQPIFRYYGIFSYTSVAGLMEGHQIAFMKRQYCCQAFHCIWPSAQRLQLSKWLWTTVNPKPSGWMPLSKLQLILKSFKHYSIAFH